MLTRLHEIYENKLRRYVACLVYDPHQAADLAQDTFAQAMSRLDWPSAAGDT